MNRKDGATCNELVKIRPATAADVQRIIDLERQCATAAHWTIEQYNQVFQVDEDGRKRLVLVTEEASPASAIHKQNQGSGRGLLGFLIALHLTPDWELENIVVAPAARRKGLGKRLLDALLAAARKQNSGSVFLEVRESNQAARALYEKAGFRQSGRRRSYYANPTEEGVLYRLDLA
jgi:ribosomal-protein-alanine acetyltransferase